MWVNIYLLINEIYQGPPWSLYAGRRLELRSLRHSQNLNKHPGSHRTFAVSPVLFLQTRHLVPPSRARINAPPPARAFLPLFS